MTNTDTTATLQERTVDLIKQGQALLAEQKGQIDSLSKTASAAKADAAAAAPILDALITKLSTEKCAGELLVPPSLRDRYRNGVSTLTGLAKIASQLADLALRNQSVVVDKTASLVVPQVRKKVRQWRLRHLLGPHRDSGHYLAATSKCKRPTAFPFISAIEVKRAAKWYDHVT